MPTIQGVTNVAAGGVSANVIAGSIYEYAPFNALATYALVGNAAGEPRVTVTHGPRTIMEESPVSRQNRFPVLPDDIAIRNAVVRRGERIVVKYRNTGAGAVDLFWNIDLRPVG